MSEKRSTQVTKTASDFPPLKNDLILRVIKGLPVKKTPVWIMRQAGRYLPEFRAARSRNDFFTICRTPELACEVTLQPIDRYDGLLDASIIFSDILVVPQAMGLEVQMVPGKGPHFPNPINNPDDIARLKDVDVETELSYVFDAITLTRQKLEGRVPLFGFAGAPWTLMAYMIEGGGSKTLSKAKTWLYKYPDQSHLLLQKITDVVVHFLIGQAKAGAQLLQVFESNGGELSKDSFEKFSLPYLNQIATRVKATLQDVKLDVPLCVFARGSHYALEQLDLSPYEVVSLDWTITPENARQRVKSKTLQGNADPSLLYADKEVIREEVKKMVKAFGKQKYIGNLGHGMYPDMDPDHLEAYLIAIRDFTMDK